MSLTPMSDRRQSQLIKAAGEVVDLVACGADPTGALTKVAAETGMNAHEVDLIAHKVNQALTLSHLENAPAEDKASPFPITNAKVVRKNLFGGTEESPHAQELKDNTSGSPLVRAKINKEAVDASLYDSTDYRFSGVKPLEYDRAAWAGGVPVELPKVAAAIPSTTHLKLAYEAARERSALASRDLDVALNQAVNPFTRTDAPQFASIEKLAWAAGVPDPVIDLIYSVGSLASIGHKRAEQVKVAQVPTRLSWYETSIVNAMGRLDQAIKTAGDALADVDLALEAYEAGEAARLDAINKQAGDAVFAVSPSVDKIHDTAHGVLDSAAGVSGEGAGMENAILDVFGGKAGEGGPSANKPMFEKDVEQAVKNTDLQSTLQTAMADPYIGGHPLPRVVDALNRATQVSEKLSEPELLSYVRHDLATDGGVPLDLQLKAHQAHQKDEP